MKLNESRVIFNEENHTYTLDGRELSGITTMLKHQLFKDEYKGVSESVLRAAAERGTLIHKSCEVVDDLGVKDSDMEEVANYIRTRDEYGLNYLCSEYLVSDNENFASCIDKVYEASDDEVILADIKTTYRLNEEYVRWQLSVYAYLFELNNPGIKVKGLMAIWLRDKKVKFVYLERVPTDEVKRLLECEVNGEQYVVNTGLKQIPPSVVAVQEELLDILIQEKSLEEAKNMMLAKIRGAMEECGIKKWETDIMTVTIKEDSERSTFDSKAFKEDNEELYNKYIKKSVTKGGLLVKDKRKAS